MDVIVDPGVPASIIGLLSSHTKQFRSLRFTHHKSRDIQRFLQLNSGPLPLLRTLEITTTERNSPGTEEDSLEAEEDSLEAEEYSLEAEDDDQEASGVMTPPSTPLFNNATNLEVFSFHSDSGWSPSLGYFAFPNLTSFWLSAKPRRIRGSQLLDLLEASPMLRIVHIEAVDFVELDLEGLPEDRVVVLRNVDNFDLSLIGGDCIYLFAAHISCPSASSTSLARTGDVKTTCLVDGLPTPDIWRTIVHQYTRNPVEEVAFELLSDPNPTCKFAFRSSDGSVLKLGFKATKDDEDENSHHSRFLSSYNAWDEYDPYPDVAEIFLDHPHFANFRRLCFCDTFSAAFPQDATRSLRRLFKSLGPLDELTLHHCYLQPYFDSFSDFCKDGDKKKAMFTPIKQLTISHCEYHKHLTRIENLAESQHALGIPFERIIFRDATRSQKIEQKLRTWVDSVEYRYSSSKEMETSIID